MNAGTITFRLLTEEQISQVHKATLDVLEKTGVVLEHPRALELLSSIGCRVTDGGRVRFPADVVEDAIRKAPDSVRVYTRDGSPKMVLQDRHVYYGNVASLPFMAEPNGDRRDYVLQDCREMTIITDGLDTLDFSTGTGLSTDVPPAVSDVHEINCMIENSPKPVLITTHDAKGLEAIIEICAVHKGGMEVFRKEPFVVYCVCPISPLKYPESVLEKLFLAVENGFPFIALPAPGAGGTSPISLAGTLVNGNAEILAGLVLTQAISPGAPFLYGGFFSVMDMACMILTHGSPEFSMLNIGQAEMARYYGIPAFSSAGCTDALSIDEQAAFEAGFSLVSAGLGGSSLVHAAGVLGSGTAVSKELLVLSDELISYLQRFFRGIDVNEELLAVEEIDSVGPGGNFMGTDMTLNLYKKEQWFPRIFQRSQFENWEKSGKLTLRERLTDRSREILRTHAPLPVDDGRLKEIRAIIEASDRERL